jgi:hypothetical protein
MSAPHFRWAMDQGRERSLPPSERLVLMVLAERANGARLCWPSYRQIAADTGLSQRTCQSAAHRLEAIGLIRRELRGRLMHYHILRPANGSDGDPTQPEIGEPWQPLPDTEAPPWQPLPVSRHDPSNHCQDQPQQPLPPWQPLPVSDAPDPGNWQQTTLATIATESLKKNPPRKEERERARAGARPRTPLPEQWQPSVALVAFGAGLGLAEREVRLAADRMRDWSLAGGKPAADWDARFRNWLRSDAEHPRRQKQRGVIDQIRHDWNLPSFLVPTADDDEPLPSVLQ